MTYTETNEQYPTFKQEAEMEAQSFRENVIAGLELAESALVDAANALAKYPGYDAQTIHDLASWVESVRLDLGGE